MGGFSRALMGSLEIGCSESDWLEVHCVDVIEGIAK
jgi:hypothetical protein